VSAFRANRLDQDGVTQHAAVANAGEYSIDVALYHRRVGNGTITCRMLKRKGGPGKRIIQLVGEYSDAGEGVTQVIQCASEVEEIEQLARLEGIIRRASRRPSIRVK
jgi:hypothetical protein